MPAYNEAGTLREIVDTVVRAPIALSRELIIVGGTSRDATPDVLRQVATERPEEASVFSHSANRGKGATDQTGIAHPTAHLILIRGVDLEYDPRDSLRLLEAICED